MTIQMFYGMNQFGILAAILIAAAIVFGMFFPGAFALGGWFTGIVLIAFALALWRTVVPRIVQPAP